MSVKARRSIVFIGVGIKFYAHMTQESISHIQECDKLFYLVNEPATIEWLKTQNSSAESLENIYFSDDRLCAYQEISKKIIQETDNHTNICIVMYGHPLVLNLPTKLTIDAISNCSLDVNVVILPGISSESVLYCDLGIDPGIGGIQSYEATELLLYNKAIEVTSHLIIWQIGIIGARGRVKGHDNKKGIKLLKKYLLKSFPENHLIKLYQASQYSHIKPIINTVKLSELNQVPMSQLVTAYIAPLSKGTICKKTLSLLTN